MSLHNISISKKLSLIIIIAFIGMIGLVAFSLQQIKTTMIEDRQLKTKNIVETAYSIVEHYATQAKNGEIDEEQAKTLAKKTLSKIRYDETEYVFITDFSAGIVMHPIKPALDGKNLADTKDPNGIYLFKEISNTAKNKGDGFVSYHWPKPGFDKAVEKLSYVKAYAPWEWAVGTGIYMDDVDAAFWKILTIMAFIVIGILILVLAGSFVVGRDISKPLGRITKSMSSLAGGDLSTEITGTRRGDEIGHMAEAVQVFKENMIKTNDLTKAQQRDQEIKEQQRSLINSYIREFEITMINVLDGLNQADTAVKKASNEVSTESTETKLQATTVASASEEATANVQTVAAAAEELSSSISEINRQVSQASTVAARAVSETNETTTQISQLEKAVSHIGEIVELINNIAEQTNLLALNATIEAARAGEAGKGFAVVASEVKNLANQTTSATEEITSQINAVQTQTAQSVDAIRSVSDVIKEINEISSTIAVAVEQQGAATQEIAMNVDQASSGTKEVSTSILQVQESSEKAEIAAHELLSVSDNLATESDVLRTQVSKFLQKVQLEDADEHALFAWSDELSCGIQSVDDEHMKLLELINKLYHEIKNDSSIDTVDKMFNQIRDYTQEHFANEEQHMEKIDYPHFKDHQEEHALFIDRVETSFTHYHNDPHEHASIELIALLASLWQKHVATTDKKFADYLKHQTQHAAE